MLILARFDLSPIAAAGLLAFLSEHLLLLIILGGILVLLLSVVFRFRRKNSKKKPQVIQPITEILGDASERVDDLNNEIKPLGFAYEPYQDIFYSLMNPWQRGLGYCKLYDEASAALSMIIDCEPITFEYAGRKWLIEFWKGQYCMNTGGEVGIYYTTDTSLNIPGMFNGNFYFCVRDEDCINMSFAFRKNGNLLFTRSGYHWWLTGFKLGEFSDPSELSMDIILELYNRKMAHAFVSALIDAGYQNDEYLVQRNKVYIRFDKPHVKQPFTRSSFTDNIIQRHNESLCSSYNYLTAAYSDTIDKLVIVRKESPAMYQTLMAVGKPKEVFDSYEKLKGHLNRNEL